MTVCYHCGLPADENFAAVIQGETRQFCCIGCQLVAQTIALGGLDNYYRYRDGLAEKPLELERDYSGFDLAEVQSAFVSKAEDGTLIARLHIQGISCAACAWLIEQHLARIAGVVAVRVNATTRGCLLQWQPQTVRLSELFSSLLSIGYHPQPDRLEDTQKIRRQESHRALMRLGVAGIGMMQVGMVAVALYAGGMQGIEKNWEYFLRWVSLVIATPVVFFSAQPFFISAWRSLQARHLNMDVPVSLAIGLAYGASVFATLTHTGEVYFDSVSMFTFFLLLGRYLEMRARHSSAFASESLRQLLPVTVEKRCEEGIVAVPLGALIAGDRIRVASGDVIPVDGVLLTASARVDESLLTGESIPREKIEGDHLSAGTLNSDTALEMRVEAVGADTELAAVERLVEKAALQKPRQIALADRIAGNFVAAVLLLAVGVGVLWWWIEPGKAFWVVLSVLVVTCPCALSLATPAALTAGVNRARRNGLLISGASAMEALAKVDQVVFDKTGTLTEGRLRRVEHESLDPTVGEDDQLAVVAALERYSSHPIAQAFDDVPTTRVATDVRVASAAGVEGEVDGKRYRFGRADFACATLVVDAVYSRDMWQLLSCQIADGRWKPLGWIQLADTLRSSAGDAVASLRQQTIAVDLLSGDRLAVVARVAETIRIEHYQADATPADKLMWIQQRQQSGRVVLMAGDGLNDVPVLSAADVSVAMGSATQLAQSRADCILLSGNLTAIPDSISLARRVQTIIRQNLGWALAYNGLALPAAALGIVPPYLAAVGMSLSSLVVVLNAMRLS